MCCGSFWYQTTFIHKKSFIKILFDSKYLISCQFTIVLIEVLVWFRSNLESLYVEKFDPEFQFLIGKLVGTYI